MKAKRIISCLLMLLMLASLMPAGFAEVGDWDPTNNGVYPDWQSATDQGQGTTPAQPSQNNSGSSSGGHTHNWQLFETVREATCTQYGKIRMICYGCGELSEIYTEMIPHSWGEWEILTEPTDHSAGERQHTCQVCGKTEKEAYYLPGTLLPGDSGQAVSDLQDLLNENGISTPQDGEYGRQTRESVKEAQRRHGLEADGIAWPQTIACLQHVFGEWEILREPTLTKAGQRRRICEKCGYEQREDFVREMGPGASGEHVKQLQDMLEKLGHYRDRRDGYYGPALTQAVEDFQREHGLPVTGIADEETLAQIAAAAGEDNGEPVRRDPYDPDRRDEPENNDGDPDDQTIIVAVRPNQRPDPEPEPEPEPDPTEQIITIQDNQRTVLEFAGIQVTKTETSEPKNKAYYTEGEVIQYLIEVKNTGTTVLEEVVVTDIVEDEAPVELGTATEVYPSESIQYVYFHTVTKPDVDRGVVNNNAFATGTDRYGNSVAGEDFARCMTGVEVEFEYPYMTKKVVNVPGDGRSYFVNGEKIEYEIVVYNPSDWDFYMTDVYDSFEGAAPVWLANFSLPAHSVSAPVPYDHVVTVEEAKAGKVLNTAFAHCSFTDNQYITLSAEVEALTGLKEEEPSDCCIRTLTGKGEGIAEYTLSYCHVHGPVAEQVKALLAAAGANPGESVWKQTAELWRAAIDAEYAGVNASGEYKNTFYTWLEAYEACLKAEYPDDAAMAAMKVSEQLMNYCADLCYLIGTAPSDRVDSLVTGSYQTLAAAAAAEDCHRTVTDGTIVSYTEILCDEHRAADTELTNALKVAKTAAEQAEAFSNNKQSWLNALNLQAAEKLAGADAETSKLILHERNAFGKMLQAEESFLTGFYPGRPEVVQEMLMNTIREHVIDFCK